MQMELGGKYKKLPLNHEKLSEMQKSSLYSDMVTEYGLENVINNYLVSFVILQEEKSITLQDGSKLDVTKKFINEVFDATQNHYNSYIAAPINNIKTWFNFEPDYLGYVPIITDHDDNMENKHGYIVAGSLEKIIINNILYLVCKGVLISPESKYNFIQELWREVSPGITEKLRIRELSFVTVPAQKNNSLLSNGENLLSIKNINENKSIIKKIKKDKIIKQVKNIDLSIKLAENKSIINKFKMMEQQKEDFTNNIINQLVNNGKIAGNNKSTLKRVLYNLSDKEQMKIIEVFNKINLKTPFNQMPQTVFLQGAIEMSTAAERFAKFKTDNITKIPDAAELARAFRESEKTYSESIRLANGEGHIKNPVVDYATTLDMLNNDNNINDDILNKFKEIAISKFNLSDGESKPTPTKQVDAGGVEHPNNSNLKECKTTPDEDDYHKKLKEGYDDFKNKIDKMGKKHKKLKAKHKKLKEEFKGVVK